MKCRVCGTECGPEILNFLSPALVSTTAILDADTIAYCCPNCQHIQKPNFPEVERFYDEDYQISLESETHDQLYDLSGEKPIYRTQYQADLAIETLNIEEGMSVLDFGCGKAMTLKVIAENLPRIKTATFDVSANYKPYWDGWVAPEDQAIYNVPKDWTGRFDRVMAHFVLEHSTDPVAVFTTIARVLNEHGRAFVTVPNVFTNPGDLLVVDHLNHFTPNSFLEAANRAGLILDGLYDAGYRGAYIATFVKRGETVEAASLPVLGDIRAIADTLSEARNRVVEFAKSNVGSQVAIYGAGFYGTFIAMLVNDYQNIEYFIDQNPHLQGNEIFGIPIRSAKKADDLPPILYAGLNPRSARSIMENWLASTGVSPNKIVYLD